MPFEQPPKAPKLPRQRSSLDREGWFRKGVTEDLDPKWIAIAERSEQSIPLVLAVRDALQANAAKARKHGQTEDFSAADCAAFLRVPETAVVSIIRVLVDREWLTRDRRIVDWPVRQPDIKIDVTAAQRQRNKRARDDARERAAMGLATPEDLELLSKREREALAKLAGMSRVTAQPVEEAKPERIEPFKAVVAKEDTYPAREIAERESHTAARRWLLGDGSTVHGYGPASKIVAENYRCTRMTADAMLRQWLQSMLQEDVALASIISAAYEHGLVGEGYQGVVERRVTDFIAERTNGPTLPFGIAAQNGGRRT